MRHIAFWNKIMFDILRRRGGIIVTSDRSLTHAIVCGTTGEAVAAPVAM